MEQRATFGQWLRRRRRALDFTQQELARRVGYSISALQKVEEDQRRPSRELVAHLLDQLEIPEDERPPLLRLARVTPSIEVPAAPTPVRPARRDPPSEWTALIGRDRETAAIRNLLTRDEVRLITLSGAPGIGKSSLGRHVLAEVADTFADGVCLVPLVAIRDPQLVPSSIARALDMQESGGTALLDDLRGQLREKCLLLMLDDFEQVVSAAPIIVDLLASAPRLKILVTSREVLRLRGEYSVVVPPLSLPDPRSPAAVEDLLTYDAIRLFVTRARAVRSDFDLTTENAAAISEICRELDGLPLAIELAAARIRLLPPRMLLAQMTSRMRFLTGGARDLPEHQRTLRGAIDWSYNLLDDDEKGVFRDLSVFVGGGTLEAIEAVCPAANLIDVLESLGDKSLIRQQVRDGELHFEMLETIREYARERLVEAGAADGAMERHRNWFIGFAERAEPEFFRHNQVIWLDRIEREHDNLRAVLRRCIASRDAARGLRLANAIYQFWLLRHIGEGRTWLVNLLAISDRTTADSTRSWTLSLAGSLAGVQGDLPLARSLLVEGLDLAGQEDDRRATAFALLSLASVDRAQGDLATARARLEASLDLWRTLADPWHLGRCLFHLGELAAGLGDQTIAGDRIRESLAIFRQLGDRWGMGYSLRALGFDAYHRGNFSEARRYYDESLALGREVGDQAVVAWTFWGLGLVDCAEADYIAARERMAACMGIFRDRQERGAIAHVLGGFAALAAAQGQPARAMRLLAAAESLREAIGVHLLPIDQADLASWTASSLGKLTDDARQRAWSRGRALSLEQAIADALSDNDSVRVE
jgi:predicted ATPase/DNA-binding XRE family transcriptional regulator